MGKKNIQPTTSSPVSRTLVVAPRPALEELRAEPQEGHISSLTGPDPSYEAYTAAVEQRDPTQWGYVNAITLRWYTSYDGDDE
jgi:bacteriocin leader peptide (microcyclamide/patellamide family)